MNFIPAISVNYSKYKDLEFLNLTNTIGKDLAGSADYSRPTPPLSEYQEFIASFQEAVQHIQAGVKGAKYERDRTRKVLEVATQQLSAYATSVTPARPDLWAAVGFPITKETSTPRPAAQPVTGFALADGDAAQTLAASVDRQAGIYGYLWRIRPKNSPAGRFGYETWISRGPSITITGLDSETSYCVQCAAWNDSGPLVWGDALSRIVQ